MITTFRRLTICAVALFAPAHAMPALAGDVRDGRGVDVMADFAFVPAEIDTVIVIRNARLFRQSAVGQTTHSIAGDLQMLPRTLDAWSELASMLDLDEEVAFDEILGVRVVFLERDAAKADQPDQWTIVCDVRPTIANDLRRRLKAAPRRILEGVPVLAIEEGRFEMAVVGEKDANRVVLAPAGSIGLMEEIARRIEGPAPRGFTAGEAAARLHALSDNADGPVDAAFFRRFPSQEAPEWLGGVVRVENATLRSELVFRTTEIEHPIEPTSIELFDALRRNSMIAIVESIDPAALDEGKEKGGYLDQIQTRVNAMLAQTGATRYAVNVGVGPNGGITAAIGVQTPNAHGAAVEVDAVVNDLLRELSRLAGLNTADFNYQGVQPGAERVADFGGAFRLLGGARLRMRWGAHDDKWWVASLPGPAGQLLADAIDNEANIVVRRWIVVGSARPSQLLETLAFSMPAWDNKVPGPLRGFTRIREVTWTAWQQTDNEVWGRIEVELLPDRARR